MVESETVKLITFCIIWIVPITVKECTKLIINELNNDKSGKSPNMRIFKAVKPDYQAPILDITITIMGPLII